MDVAPVTASVLPLALQSAAGAGARLFVGFAYFIALQWNVGFFERGATMLALVLTLARLAALIVVFLALAKLGAVPLLAAALGLLVARQIVLRRLGRSA